MECEKYFRRKYIVTISFNHAHFISFYPVSFHLFTFYFLFIHRESLIYRKECHTGPVKALQFNPFNHHYLVSGSVDGQILLSDANDASKTQAPGQGKSQNLEDITSLAWNCQVPHILAASSNNGCVVIWDLRHKREVIKLSSTSGGKFSISSLCWNPDNATQIITACEDDSNPVINFWDLRNAHAPEKVQTQLNSIPFISFYLFLDLDRTYKRNSLCCLVSKRH